MRYFLVQVNKLGAFMKHPEINHKNYKNAGYDTGLNDITSNYAQCIWVAEDTVDLVSDAEVNNDSDKIQEITDIEAQNYIEQWKADKDLL